MTKPQMLPYQERVVEEASDLRRRLTALTFFKDQAFFRTLDQVDQNLLQEQWMAMTDYLDILELRIERFSRETSVHS